MYYIFGLQFVCKLFKTVTFLLSVPVPAGSPTYYDKEFTSVCLGNNEAVVSIESIHNNYFEDRIWTFTCAPAIAVGEFAEENCVWSQYTYFKASIQFICPNNALLTGIHVTIHIL